MGQKRSKSAAWVPCVYVWASRREILVVFSHLNPKSRGRKSISYFRLMKLDCRFLSFPLFPSLIHLLLLHSFLLSLTPKVFGMWNQRKHYTLHRQISVRGKKEPEYCNQWVYICWMLVWRAAAQKIVVQMHWWRVQTQSRRRISSHSSFGEKKRRFCYAAWFYPLFFVFTVTLS